MSEQEHLELSGPSRTYQLDGDGTIIGRADDCAVRLESRSISARHATVSRDEHGWWISDLVSTNGTRVDGSFITGPTPLVVGTEIALGDQTLSVTAIVGPPRSATGVAPAQRTAAARWAATLTDPTIVHTLELRGHVLKIGRGRSNDIEIRDPNVSRFHAELRHDGTRWTLHDLGSTNGTRLNGIPVKRAEVSPGSEIALGHFQLLVNADEVRTESRAGWLEALGIEQRVKGSRCILQPTDVSLVPGELTGIVGEAGSGKSTLMRILAGAMRPSAGRVTLDGEALAHRLVDVGYVAQENVLHRELTAREALTYRARLRLPEDTTADEITAAVERVLRDLDMHTHADIRIGGGLSGGQQRRIAVGMELLGSPQVLLLDEPGASLDIVHERQLMALLRRVTHRGCAVVCITHHTASLAGFDRLLVMASGGLLRFNGRPEAALMHFAVPNFEAMYERLATLPAAPAPAPAAASQTYPAPVSHRRRSRAFGHHTRALTSRATRILSRDRRNLAVLLLQAPVLAAGAVLMFGAEAFGRPGHADRSAQMLFTLVLICSWIGAVDGARALVAERPLFIRERALGVAAEPYLASKLIVLGALAIAQGLMLATVAFTIDPLHAPATTYATVIFLLVAATEVSMATGLLLSALVSSENQAGSTLPLLLVPQVLCAGAIVAVNEMGPIAPLSLAVSSRWALAGSGSALWLAERPAANASFIHVYGKFYLLSWSTAALVLLGLLTGISWLTLSRLRRAWRS
jgi:ABC-type multidrug transport system ATPase subunit/pSer/pThr/pTyr-binding forkhead associated (FHA) protein